MCLPSTAVGVVFLDGDQSVQPDLGVVEQHQQRINPVHPAPMLSRQFPALCTEENQLNILYWHTILKIVDQRDIVFS